MAEKLRSFSANERFVVLDALEGRIAVLERSKARETNEAVKRLRDDEIRGIRNIQMMIQNEELGV